MTQLSSLTCGLILLALAAVSPAAPAGDIPGIDEVPDEVLFEFDSPDLKLPPAVIRSGLTPRTAQMLGEAFTRPGTTIDRRVELVRDLGRSMLPEAVPFMRTALSDESELVRATAARGAGQSRQVQLAGDLLNHLTDPSPDVRAAVVAAHAMLTPDRTEPSPAVIAGLQDSDPAVRLAAITHIAVVDESVILRDLLSSLTGSPKLEAIAALARVEAPQTVNTLAALLDDGDIGVRSAAITALGQLQATSQAGRIEAFVKADHPTVRRAAVAALPGVHGAERARELGEPMLDDPDLSVQRAAAALVVPVRSAAIVGALLDRLSSPYLELHDAALASLAQPADDAIRQMIIARAVPMLDLPDARRRQDAAFLLGAFASDVAVEKLIEFVSSTGAEGAAIDGAVVRQAANALGRIGDQRAAAALKSVADRGTAFILASATGNGKAEDALAGAAVDEALVALGRLGDPGVVQPAIRVLRSNLDYMPPEARKAAAWAIGQTGNAGDNALRDPLLIGVATTDPSDAAFESIKAIGRLRLESAQTQLLQAAEKTSDPRVRWIALWAIHRLTGRTEPYVTPIATQSPSLVIQDRAGR